MHLARYYTVVGVLFLIVAIRILSLEAAKPPAKEPHKENRESGHGRFQFRHHFGDRALAGDGWGQTALTDVDRDGDLDFITGRRGGDVIWFEYHSASQWTQHLLGNKSPSDVGGIALDVNKDGWPDFVVGGVWYENSGSPQNHPFQRHVFDKSLTRVHDVILGDLNGDKRLDVITMSDQHDVRWYEIPADAKNPWKSITIGEAVHSGISVGDIDADGDLDVVRSNIWFENLGKGQKWIRHQMTKPWGRNNGQPWERNATQTRTADINSDGHLDVIIADGENHNARIAWLEASGNPKTSRWTTHFLPRHDSVARGAFHSLQVADFNGDGAPDIFTVEMEAVPGDKPPRWFLWENRGAGKFREHVILDNNLGGHEAVVGDVDGDGDLDICSKLWRASKTNANRGRNHFDYLENLAK